MYKNINTVGLCARLATPRTTTQLVWMLTTVASSDVRAWDGQALGQSLRDGAGLVRSDAVPGPVLGAGSSHVKESPERLAFLFLL